MAEGLTFEVAQEGGPLCSEKRENVAAALQRLQATPGVVGIAGDCGFLMNYLADARSVSKLPCFISALIQCDLMATAYGDEAARASALPSPRPSPSPSSPAPALRCSGRRQSSR